MNTTARIAYLNLVIAECEKALAFLISDESKLVGAQREYNIKATKKQIKGFKKELALLA